MPLTVIADLSVDFVVLFENYEIYISGGLTHLPPIGYSNFSAPRLFLQPNDLDKIAREIIFGSKFVPPKICRPKLQPTQPAGNSATDLHVKRQQQNTFLIYAEDLSRVNRCAHTEAHCTLIIYLNTAHVYIFEIIKDFKYLLLCFTISKLKNK